MTVDDLADSSFSQGSGLKLLASCHFHHAFHHSCCASRAVRVGVGGVRCIFEGAVVLLLILAMCPTMWSKGESCFS